MSHSIQGLIGIIKGNRVVKNFSYLTISSVLSQLISLVTIVKISKVFIPEEYGAYTFVFAQAQLITIIGDLGLRYIVIRKISRDFEEVNDLIVNGLKLRIIAVMLIMLVYMVYNSIFGDLSSYYLIILFLFSIASCFSNLFESVFFGRQNMFMPSLVNLIFNIGWAAFVFLTPINLITLNLLISAQFVWGLIKTIGVYFILKHKGYLIGSPKPFVNSSKNLLSESWPYFVQVIIILPILYLSNNFLDLNSTKEEIGFFNLSQKMTGPINMIIGFALSAIFPNIAVLWTNDQQRFKRMITKGFKFIIIPSAFACFVVTIYAKEVVLFLFSEKYLPAVEACQLQLWYVLLMGVNSFIGTVWGAADKQTLIFKSSIVNSIIATPMLYIGSYYGALGISYAYLISFVLFELFLWHVFIKSIEIKIDMALVSWTIALVLFASSFYLIHNLNYPLKLTSVLAVLIVLIVTLKKPVLSYLNAKEV